MHPSSPPPPAEFYGALTGANYYSVALVDASFCTPGVTLASLKVRIYCAIVCLAGVPMW